MTKTTGILLIVLIMNSWARAVSVTPGEMDLARHWTATRFEGTTEVLPFSFSYNGQPSAKLIEGWSVKKTQLDLDAQRTQTTLVCTDPQTGLVVRCVRVEYQDFPTVEWTLYFKNEGATDTPILSDIEALDARLERSGKDEFMLHHQTGALATIDDFQPFETALPPRETKRITTSGGRSSNSNLPYFNIAWSGEGVIVAVGWPGQWAAQFDRDEGNGLRVRAGQELTHFKLHPGEEVRSPLMVLQFWKGDWLRAQNVWRQWMIAHNLPKANGEPLKPTLFACSSHQFGEMINANEANQKLFIDRYLEEGLNINYWWMDAGWYVNKTGWPNTGTWEVDTNRFPHGLRAVSDHAHARGVKILVWFEPERVTPGTWLYEQHPDWLLGADGGQKLLDLGNPQAWEWLTDHVDHLLTAQGIDLYRQDFNMDPLSYWRANDAPDRQGITEIRHVTGYLAYWDELCRRHPGLLLDTCASGGRRIDLETLRRAVPRTRSDYLLEPVGEQSHTYGLAFWVPYYGSGYMDAVTSGRKVSEAYLARSFMYPVVISCIDVRRKDVHYELIRRLFAQWRQLAPLMLEDYYPLTPFSTANDSWLAWQFDCPKTGHGMVQAFRRPGSYFEAARWKLHALEPDARYVVSNVDIPGVVEKTGRQLMEEGLRVQIREQPGAAIYTYQRLKTNQ
ncbi:MAG: alpha-galactosidase [Candidatus Omnitrophica bacterium]|nr:alpha-galactosidase [Candidatus Omnitrophota bacterium]